jgi:hypothetical protein
LVPQPEPPAWKRSTTERETWVGGLLFDRVGAEGDVAAQVGGERTEGLHAGEVGGGKFAHFAFVVGPVLGIFQFFEEFIARSLLKMVTHETKSVPQRLKPL